MPRYSLLTCVCTTAVVTAAATAQVSGPGGGPGDNPWIHSAGPNNIADEHTPPPSVPRPVGETRTIRLVICTPEGVPLAGVSAAATTIDGVMTKATPVGPDGVHYVAGVGAKTTIELHHSAYGTTISELTLPDARVVGLEILMGAPIAQARVLYENGVMGLLSAVAPEGGIAGGSNCCEPHGGLGCDDPDCEALVCAIDPFCCDTAWDGICAGEAADLCGDLCGGGGGGGCTLDCPGGALEEGEACGSDTNGGCNSTPPVYTAAACGDTFCGNAWASAGMRDTDWYLVDLPDPDGNGTQELRGTLTSQFDGICFIVDGIASCAPVVVGEAGTSNDCVAMTDAVACLPAPGTYVVFVATADFDGTPCDSGDNDYVLEISCADCDAGGGPCDGADGDCCMDNGTPGCNDADCCNLVCGVDPFCCDVAWDGICADEAADLCGDLCDGAGPCPGEGDCCTPGGNGTPGCDDADCCNLVCGVDPFCCDTSWDGICADEAADLCGDLCGNGVDCPGEGDCCTPGGNGTPGCDDADCCNLVCGVDPFCCDTSWDGICADEAADLCGDLCFIPPSANDDCADAIEVAIGSNTTGTTLGATEDANAIFCDTSVSVGGVWYSVTGDGSTMTASFCEVFASDCCFANGTPGCSDADCEAIVCAVDPFCCDVSWDGICAGEAQDLCGDLCSQAGGGSADYDSKISVYCGDCEDLACVGGNDDTCGLQSQVTWCSQNGATYLIFVHGFGGAQGNFDLFVTSDGVPCDAEVFCLPVEACCFPGGDCEDLTPDDCRDQGGLPQGSGTTCFGEHVFNVEECTSPFEDISGTGILAPIASTTDDGGDAGIPIGFTFDFFKDDHTTVGIASNGYLTFGTDLSDFTNDPVPTAEDPNDAIFPLWDDWSPNQSGTVHYQTLGAAGSQRFIAQWTNVPHFNTGDTSTFQAVLFEGSNCIEFRYGDPLSYVDPTVGVENQDGSDGYPGGFGPVVASGDCLRLCPEQVGGVACCPQDVIWAVCDDNVADSQLAVLNLATGVLTAVGPVHPDADIEAMSYFNGSVLGVSGDLGDPHDLSLLNFCDGSLTPGVPVDFDVFNPTQVTGMATDGYGVVWAYVEGAGFATIAADGTWSLEVPYVDLITRVDGVAASDDGSTLWAMTNDGRILEVDVGSDAVALLADLSGMFSDKIENLVRRGNELHFFVGVGDDIDTQIQLATYDLDSGEVTTQLFEKAVAGDVETFVYACETDCP